MEPTPPPIHPLRIAPIEAPTLASVRPKPPAAPGGIEPYRVLFPIGALAGIAGTALWIAQAFGAPWPGMLHASLMMQGFELCFVTGFLLTAMPSFTHGDKCTPLELGATTAAALAFLALHAVGVEGPAQLCFTFALLVTATAILRRVRFDGAAPPEEFLLAGVGLLLGIAGGLHQASAAFGWLAEPQPRFGVRLVSRGMLLAVVLGLGGLLVPTFAMVKDPLRIVGIARAGQRGPRRVFVLALAALIAGAFLADTSDRHTLAAWMRAAAAIASTQLSWKSWSRPGRRDPLTTALWLSGWMIVLGITAAAAFPAHEIAAWHVTFVGGFGLLTMAIGTRVTVTHGGHPGTDEPKVLGWASLALLGAALLSRLAGGEVDPTRSHALAGAAAAWVLAWALWLSGALPRVLRKARKPAGMMMPSRPKR